MDEAIERNNVLLSALPKVDKLQTKSNKLCL